ncbi:LTA synthase family protein [Dokdonella sp.]|uniref:LTA synthase family protein n=1 Tax=Dokdonella sp. TaxID=2291710 RepID=UPI001B08CFB3|nr:LTA synthase family protein [Dokdonella sp.]MBO9664341.1 LTA synthase family protein [Dokdonella sp.]
MEIVADIPAPPRRLYVRETARAFACALAILFAVGQLDPGIDLYSLPQHDIVQRLVLNALPALTLFGLLIAMTRRVLLPCWLVLLAIGALYAANSAKLGRLQAPLLPGDLRFLTEPGPALRLFSQYLHFDAIHLLVLAGALALSFALCRERRLQSLSGWRAPLLGALALLSGLGLLAGSTPWRRLYQSTELAFQPWALTESVVRTGLIGSLLVYHWEITGNGVPAADREAAVALLRRHAPTLRSALAASTFERPDIVVVQSESLFDPARLRGVLSGRYLHEYRRLAQRATYGDMVVPTYAGGTIRTEFEVLTGAPLRSLGGVQYPWLELDGETYPGIAHTLAAQGYRTLAIHPNAAAFWNRTQAYEALGFERFVDGAAFADAAIVGLFTADAALTDRVLAELADDGPPQFVFAISMENHGPHDWRPDLDAQRLAALPMPEGLDAGAREWFANYLYLLDDADRELGRLADALLQRQRRTLLLFYGDHLPDLAPVYAQLGFDDGREATRQPVPWLLLDSATEHMRHLDARSWSLPALLLDAAGVADDAYFGVLAALLDDEDFDPDNADASAGLDALARLHLRGELEPVVAEALDSIDADDIG